jgi:hypothetical protein
VKEFSICLTIWGESLNKSRRDFGISKFLWNFFQKKLNKMGILSKKPQNGLFSGSGLHAGTHQGLQMGPRQMVGLTQMPLGKVALMAIHPSPQALFQPKQGLGPTPLTRFQ